MSRHAQTATLVLALLVSLAAPALAGEEVDGDGYSIRLPDGFTEAMSIENSGPMRIRSNFGSLPIAGMPEMTMYTRPGAQAGSMIMLARVDLAHDVTESSEQLAQQQIAQIRERLPDGCEAQVRTISGHTGVELRIVHETPEATLDQRILTVLAGDYCVVVMLQTVGDDGAAAAGQWSGMIGSLAIQEGLDKLLLLALIGGGGILGLWILSRVRLQKAVEEPEYTGRFKRHADSQTGPGLPPRERPQIGRRPKVLQGRTPEGESPAFAARAGAHGAAARERAPRSAQQERFAGGGPAVPVRTATSPAVTRPSTPPPGPRRGLKPTLPESGRYGQ